MVSKATQKRQEVLRRLAASNLCKTSSTSVRRLYSPGSSVCVSTKWNCEFEITPVQQGVPSLKRFTVQVGEIARDCDRLRGIRSLLVFSAARYAHFGVGM